MGERLQGNNPQLRRRRSGRRGVFPTPQGDSYVIGSYAQSQQDRQRLQEIFRGAQPTLEIASTQDLGNKELPVYKNKSEILDKVASNKVVKISGKTGCGKSTQVPQYLYEAGYDKTYVLVPRRVIANNLVDRLREELISQLGDQAEGLVGVAHGERSELDDSNRIIVLTPNTYNRMEPSIQEKHHYDKVAIISDEIHEANLYTEIATGVAAQGIVENPDWRLIVSSATHDGDSLERSLAQLNQNKKLPSVDIEGRPFEVEMHEAPEMSPMEVYTDIGHDHAKAIIFTSGKKEIDYIIEKTKDQLGSNRSRSVIFRKLHSELSPIELSRINDPVPEGYRLVIVSSPAGNSGITIPGTTLVITDGTVNREELDEDGIPGLLRHYASQAEIIQQSGRAGRDVPGGLAYLAKPVVFNQSFKNKVQYGEEYMPFRSLSERDEHAPPEIYNTNLSRVVLGVANLDRKFDEINQYIPHRVSPLTIINANEALMRLGALNDDDVITQTGRMMDKFQLSPELARGVVEAQRKGTTQQNLARIAIIAAAVDTGGLADFSDKHATDWKDLLRPTTADDFIAQLDLYLASEEKVNAEYSDFRWLADNKIHYKRAEQTRKIYGKTLHTLGMHPKNIDVAVPTLDEEAEIREFLASGMIDLTYKRAGGDRRSHFFRNIHSADSGKNRMLSDRSITPGQTEYVTGFPRWFVIYGKKGPEDRDIVEMTMPVDPLVIGKYALQNNILESRSCGPRLDGDTVVEYEQPTFGSIKVGEPVKRLRDVIPNESIALLTAEAKKHPGKAQMLLRELTRELHDLMVRLPEEMWNDYFRNIDKMPTTASIDSLVHTYARETRSLHELDQKFAEYIYHNNIDRSQFIGNDKYAELVARSPKQLEVLGTQKQVHYSKGVPYLTRLSLGDLQRIGGNIFLEDGRPVLVQVAKEGGRGTVRIEVSDFLAGLI